jgi:hypothetical protein
VPKAKVGTAARLMIQPLGLVQGVIIAVIACRLLTLNEGADHEISSGRNNFEEQIFVFGDGRRHSLSNVSKQSDLP